MGENYKHEVDMGGSRVGWGKAENVRFTDLGAFLAVRAGTRVG